MIIGLLFLLLSILLIGCFDNEQDYKSENGVEKNISFTKDEINHTLSVESINYIQNWSELGILGNANIPTGLIKEGDRITNCSGLVRLYILDEMQHIYTINQSKNEYLFFLPSNEKIGEWFFPISNRDFYNSSICYYGFSDDLNPYNFSQMGIKNVTWFENDTLKVTVHESINCAYSIANISYEFNNKSLILSYDVVITPDEVAMCNCLSEIIYIFTDLERNDYNISLIEK